MQQRYFEDRASKFELEDQGIKIKTFKILGDFEKIYIYSFFNCNFGINTPTKFPVFIFCRLTWGDPGLSNYLLKN